MMLLLGVVLSLVVAHDVEAKRCASPQSSICPNGRENYIFLTGQGMAGLGDRMLVLIHLGALADAFCAKFVVGAPSRLLGPGHQRMGGQIPENTWWDKYVDLRNGDNETLLSRNIDLNHLLSIRHSKKNSTFEEDDDHCEQKNCSKKRTGLSRIDDTDGDIMQQLHRARESNEGFVWLLSQYFFSFPKEFEIEVQSMLTGCRRVTHYEPPLVSHLADLAIARLPSWCAAAREEQNKNSSSAATAVPRKEKTTHPLRSLLAWHLRRGDVESSCDTAIPAIVDLTACARKAFGVTPSHVVVFSDEVNREGYLDPLATSLDNLFEEDTCTVLGDDYIRQVLSSIDLFPVGFAEAHRDMTAYYLDPADNYLVFVVAVAMQNRADIFIERRRWFCPKCSVIQRFAKQNNTKIATLTTRGHY